MKSRILSSARLSLPVAATIAALAVLPSAFAQTNGTWDGGGSTAIWGGVNNWNPNGQIADGVGATATFGTAFTSGTNIQVNTNRTIGNITHNSTTTDITISQTNSSVFTLDVSTGSPTITVGTAARTLTITAPISGSDGVTKAGAGTLILNATNPFTGSLVVNAGTTRVSSASAAGTNATIASNSTSTNTVFAATGASALSFSKSVSLNTAGGAITFGDATGTGNLTFTGNLTRASGSTNRAVNVAGSTTATFNGNLLSPGAGASTTFTKGGTGTLAILGTGSAGDPGFSQIVVAGGTLAVTRLADLGTASSLGTATAATPGAVSITLDGGTLRYVSGGGLASSTNRLLQIGRTTDGASGTIRNDATSAAETVTFSNTDSIAYGSIDQTRTLILGGTNTGANTLASLIGDNGTAAVSLSKEDAGTWFLTGTNTYSGATSISGGTLGLSGTGSVNTSSGITVNGSGAAFVQNSSTAVSPTVTLTQGTVTGNGTINSVNVGAGTGGIVSNNNGVGGASLTIGTLDFAGAATVNTFHTAGNFSATVATTNLSTNAAGNVTLNASAPVWTNGTYSLLSYTGPVVGAGAGQVVLGTVSGLSGRQSASALTDTGSAFTLTISGDTPKWTGLDSGNWQTGTTGANENWSLVLGGTATSYLDNDDVLFDDTAAGSTTIDINASNVAPFATTFNNSTKNYTLGSTGGFGIASGPLTKSGTGTLTITNANSSSSATIISGGVLDVSTDGAQLYSGATPIASQVTVGSGGVLVVKHFGQGSTTGLGSPSLGNLNNNGGQVVIDGGTLRFNNETSSRGRVIDVGPNGATFDVVNSSNYTWSVSPGTSVPFSGTGQTLTLTGDASSTGQINLVIGGTNVSLVKNGLATWRLTGNNTYTGGTTVNEGTLQANVTSAPLNALGTGAVSVATGATLIVNNTTTTSGATTTVNSTFTGTGLLKLQFAANTNAKNTQMPNSGGFSGTIQLSSLGTTGDKWNASNLGTVPGSLTVDSGNTLYVVSGTTSFTGGITLSGTGNNEGRGVIRLNNATLGGNVTLTGDSTINMDNASALLTGDITSGVAAPLTLTLGATGSTGGTLGGIIGGGTDVINLATAVGGTYTLTNANTYTGTTTIASATTLQLGNGTTGNDGSINGTSGVTNDGTLTFNPFGSVSAPYAISGTGGIVKNGPGTQTLAGANSYGGATTVNAGTLVLSGANTNTGATTVNSGTLSLDYSTEDNSKLSDTDVLTLAGGSLVLSAGTHSEVVGSTTLAANTASSVTSAGAVLRMGTITRNVGASINFGASGIATTDTLNDANGILGTWATINGSDYAVNSTNGVDGLITTPAYVDVTRLDGGTQIIPDGGTSFVRIIEGTGSPANLTLAAATTSMATLTQSAVGGSSAATIDPAGQTLATGAILSATGAGALIIGTGTNNGNVQSLTAGGDLSVSTLGSSTVTLNSVVADNTSSTLTKLGAGTLVLNGANTHAGGTTLSEGILQLGNAAALGTGSLTLTGGTLDSGVVNLVNANNNAQTWGGNFGFLGSQNLDLGTGAVTLTLTPQVNVSASTLTVGGVIGGSFGVAKTGPGTLTLSGANEYTGTTTVTDGVLNLTGNRTLPPTGVGIDVGGTGIPMATLNIQGDIAMGSSQFRVGLLGAGTVNHTAGNVVYTSGNQMTIGTGAGFACFYNFSGGGITSAASTTRGLLIASNANCIATFNLSGTANLDLATGASLLSLGRSDSTVNGSNATFNQTGGTATVGTLTLGGAASGSSGVTSALNLSAGQFTANAFTVLAAGNTNDATINISGTADVTLPAFPTARGTGSTATISFDGGTLRPAAASTAYMGGLTNAFIKAGGAKFDTGFDITVSQVLLEDPVSTGGGLTKEGASTLILSGANTYTGVTNVNAGTLQLGNASALGTTAGNTIVASGARIFAQNGVSNQIVPEPITLSGTGTDGTGALRFGGGVAGVTMSGPITLGADTLIKSDGSTSATFSGGISISDKVLTFATDSGATNTVSTAGISGTTGSVVKTGTGTLTLAAAGTFSGGTSHEGGIINVNDSNALGSGTAALNGGIRYVIGDGVDVANAFALGANAGTAGNGLIQVATGTTGTVSGPINITSGAAGGGHFASAGTGVLNITGPITSTTTVSNRNGTVVHSGGGTGYTTTNVGQGTVRLGANDGIATTATMTIAASAAAFFDLAGFNQSMVGVLKGGFAATIGNSSETSDSTLTLTGTSSYAGVIQDVLGTGTMKLNLAVSGGNFTVTGNNTYSGPTTVTNGTLLVNNTTGSGTGTSAVTVNAGTLGGTGIISGAVTMGDGTGSADSVLAPGSAGIESLDTGALVFASDASYSVEVDGTSATSDQTIVTGSVAIDAATTLSVNVSGTLVGGQKFFIVVNDDVDAVSGTFATFGQDALVGTFGGINLKISYTGDSVGNTTTGGNDIVLYAEAASTPYGDWAIAKGLDGTPGKEAGKADDPDKDGKNNLHEFAFDGDPLSGANDGKVVGKVATVGGDDVLTLTLPVRNGATFTTDSGDLVSDTTDGVVYRIEGDTSLDPFADAITEVTPALDGGLPALSTGWTYRTFRAPGKVGTDPKAFLRAKVTSDTP